MTFVPGSRSNAGPTAVVRTILFWLLMTLLAIVLWKMSSRSDNNGTPETELNYTDFMQQVDQKNIASAKFYTSKTTSEVHGTLRHPPGRYRVTIPNELVRSVTDQLRSEGATIQMAAGSSWAEFVVNAMPFVLLLSVWIYLMKRRMAKTPPTTTAGDPQNRPIG